MELSANTKAVLSIIAAVGGLVASGTLHFPDSVPKDVQTAIVQWDAFILSILFAGNAVLHYMPDTPPLPVPPTIAKVLAFFALVLLAWGAIGAPDARADVSLTGTPPVILHARAAYRGVEVAAGPPPSYPSAAPPSASSVSPSPTAAASSILKGNSPATILQSIISKGTADIIADAKSADSVAGAPNPMSTSTPPDVIEPLAHTCLAGIPAASPPIPGLIAWLGTLPQPSAVPSPTGPGGPLTSLVVAEANVDMGQAFVAQLTATGFPASLKIACAAWAQKIINTPVSLVSNVTSDLANLVTLFGRGN